ncbi:MAG: hypothetical protein Kow0063_18570 [Anaerolineae bacterium]
MGLYIHLVQQELQTAGLALPCEDDTSDYHALFAFEILQRPFAEFRGRIWNPMMAGPLFEAWDRQVHLIESLHLPGADSSHHPVFELRFVACPDQDRVDLFFLGKASASTPDQARSQALALGEEVFSLFPFDFVLHPLSSQPEFERAYRSEWIAGLKQPEQIVEVRRFERVVPSPIAGNELKLLYLTHSWEWHLQSMDQVWCALAKYRQPLMFCISLSPMLWEQADYPYLNELETVVSRGEFTSGLAREVESALKLYHQLLYQTPHPFTMRVVLAGAPAVPRGLANAVGAGLCLPPVQMGDNEFTLRSNYTLALPASPIDFSRAELNLTQLSQYDWGANQIGFPIRRLRYAVNARQAQAAFRIPIPPEAGFPDVSIGREVD